MLPIRCIQPPCMNIAVKRVAASAPGSSENRAGTKAQSVMNPSPWLSSRRNTTTLRAISAMVT